MVRADDLVAVGHVGLGPEEQRAVVGHVVEEVIRVLGHHLDVFGGDLVGNLDHLLVRVANDHLAVVAPRLSCDVRRREHA